MSWAIKSSRDSIFSFQELDTFVERNIQYSTSSNEIYVPSGMVHGHKPAAVLDRNLETFWLSVGNSTPSASFAIEFIEFDVQELINVVGIYPFAGNYTVYVSIQESGHWRGIDKVPYAAGLTGLYTGDDSADIGYMQQGSVPWETPILFYLPRPMGAQKVRLSFGNLQYTQWGPYNYRAGLREVTVGFKRE